MIFAAIMMGLGGFGIGFYIGRYRNMKDARNGWEIAAIYKGQADAMLHRLTELENAIQDEE